MLPGLELVPQCIWLPFLNISQLRYVLVFARVVLFKVLGLERPYTLRCDFAVCLMKMLYMRLFGSFGLWLIFLYLW